ncbi:HK97 gp10 family phage protein [Fulvimarina sp. 2208YS6-2-32]|uniref:HK97 gp10 family phage protein n=1 Tax=Fulvimarina uroteuthidis TaxID=3098149 RepID=A0ABU5HYR1_9HYPH|nr:HK97 gp10 family phage protein [Fulvimarina sp. 2208YS6-2-32]MDY8108259.1 HK97 gp10 family phage protein [Fulvimarina sp. 2208YS6-2-32]
MAGFAAAVGAWADKIPGAMEAIFRESASRLARELTLELERLVYERPQSPDAKARTGFLRASLVASKASMPTLSRANPGVAADLDQGAIELAIQGAEIGETIFLGYTANYGAYIHYGSGGRPARPWVTMVAQRWPQIVADVTRDLKRRLGL